MTSWTTSCQSQNDITSPSSDSMVVSRQSRVTSQARQRVAILRTDTVTTKSRWGQVRDERARSGGVEGNDGRRNGGRVRNRQAILAQSLKVELNGPAHLGH